MDLTTKTLHRDHLIGKERMFHTTRDQLDQWKADNEYHHHYQKRG